MAGLQKYFTPQTRSECLPDPRGPLSREIPSSAITAANSEVKAILGNESKKERGHYHKLSPEIKADLGKYASVNGVVAMPALLTGRRGHCVTNSRKNGNLLFAKV